MNLMEHTLAAMNLMTRRDLLNDAENELSRLDEEIADLIADVGGDPGRVRWPRYSAEYLDELYERRDALTAKVARLRESGA